MFTFDGNNIFIPIDDKPKNQKNLHHFKSKKIYKKILIVITSLLAIVCGIKMLLQLTSLLAIVCGIQIIQDLKHHYKQ